MATHPENGKAAELSQTAGAAISAALAGQGGHEVNAEVSRVAQDLVGHFASITPPEVKIEFLRPDPQRPYEEIQSIKPGNIRLNMRELITAIAGGVLTVVGVVAAPWTILLGGIVIWATLRKAATVELREREASVLWTMWEHKDANRCIADADLFDLVNTERERHGYLRLSRQEVERAIDKLLEIGCIELSINDDSKWWLQEWMSEPYES
jgi:hypothetical protein